MGTYSRQSHDFCSQQPITCTQRASLSLPHCHSKPLGIGDSACLQYSVDGGTRLAISQVCFVASDESLGLGPLAVLRLSCLNRIKIACSVGITSKSQTYLGLVSGKFTICHEKYDRVECADPVSQIGISCEVHIMLCLVHTASIHSDSVAKYIYCRYLSLCHQLAPRQQWLTTLKVASKR